jgi:hypothetical protein
LEKKPTNIEKERLLLEGFNFRYMTQQGVGSDGQSYQICYDVGLISELDRNYRIVLARDVVH